MNADQALLQFTGGGGSPGITQSLATPQVYRYKTLSVDYDEDVNTTILGATETDFDYLGSPFVLGSPELIPPGSPPFSGEEFFFPPYGSDISGGDVFVIYPVVDTTTLRIVTRPSPYYGSPVVLGTSPSTPIWPDIEGSPLSGSPKALGFFVGGSPAIYPSDGSPTPAAGNTITIKSTTPGVFLYGQEVEIRNASEPTLNRAYNIFNAVDLFGSPNLVELTVLDSVLADTTNDGELVFTPDGFSGGDLCGDVPPEFIQTVWMENLDNSWRFQGLPDASWVDANFIHRRIGSPKLVGQNSPGAGGNGAALSSDGNRAFIGFTGANGIPGAHVSVLDRVGNTYIPFVRIEQPPGGGTNDAFGAALDITDDGQILVVSSFQKTVGGDNAVGCVFVYELPQTITGSPSLIRHDIPAPNPDQSDRFGEDVEISNDGLTIIVGSRVDDIPVTDVGNAFIYEKIASPSSWNLSFTIEQPGSPKITNSNFGVAVSIDSTGKRVAVGETVGVGRAMVFRRDTSGSPNPRWLLEDTVEPIGSPIQFPFYGAEVALSPDGLTLVVSSGGDDQRISNAGAVYVYNHVLGSPSAIGSPHSWVLEKKIYADVPVVNAFFGGSIDLSNDGTFLAVGADDEDVPEAEDGAAYIFKRDITGSPIWQQQLRFTARGGSPQLGSPNPPPFGAPGLVVPGSNQRFGGVTRLSGDGQKVIIGMQFFNAGSPGGSGTGAAYIYDSITATQVAFNASFQHFILAADSSANTYEVQGDVRDLLADFGTAGSPAVISVIIQHAVSAFGSPFESGNFGSPGQTPLSSNNTNTYIRSITYDVDTNRSTIFVDSVSANTPTGWIIYNP